MSSHPLCTNSLTGFNESISTETITDPSFVRDQLTPDFLGQSLTDKASQTPLVIRQQTAMTLPRTPQRPNTAARKEQITSLPTDVENVTVTKVKQRQLTAKGRQANAKSARSDTKSLEPQQAGKCEYG